MSSRAAATARAASASVQSVTVGRSASFESRWKPRLRLRANCNFKHDGTGFVYKENSFFFEFVIPQLACGRVFGSIFMHLCHTHVALLLLCSPCRGILQKEHNLSFIYCSSGCFKNPKKKPFRACTLALKLVPHSIKLKTLMAACTSLSQCDICFRYSRKS